MRREFELTVGKEFGVYTTGRDRILHWMRSSGIEHYPWCKRVYRIILIIILVVIPNRDLPGVVEPLNV